MGPELASGVCGRAQHTHRFTVPLLMTLPQCYVPASIGALELVLDFSVSALGNVLFCHCGPCLVDGYMLQG